MYGYIEPKDVARISEAIKTFTDDLLREPGAKERCRALLKTIMPADEETTTA